jgi:general secretion pathway protein D
MTVRSLALLVLLALAVPAAAQQPPAPQTTPAAAEPSEPAPTGPTGPGRRRRPPPGRAETAPAPAPVRAVTPTPAPPAPKPAAAVEVTPKPVPPPGAAPLGPQPVTPTVTAPPPGSNMEAPGEDAELYKCRNLSPNERIRVTLKPDTGLTDLVAWVMGFTCKSFIFGNAISGRASKVTIIAPSQMSPPDAYRLFLVALQTMNLTVVPKGHSLEIVESQRGREMPVPVYRGGGNAPATDQVVRVIMRPDHVSPDELSQVLAAMKTGTGVVTPIPAAGVVIVTDYGSTIDKMMDVLKDVDAAGAAEKIYIIYLNNADAQEMAGKLSEIFGIGKGGTTGAPAPVPRQPPNAPPQPGMAPVTSGGGGGGRESVTPSKIIPDQRTNSLIVIASERAYQRILALVRRLDPPIAEGETGQIHVYPLSNADAEALAGTMNTLITGQAPRPSTGGRPGAPPVAQPSPSAVSGQPSGAFEGAIKLTHDKPTNSLVIVSSAKDFFALREVIRRLDLPRRQVFVEATILEVSLDRTRKIGFSYHGGATFDLKNTDDTAVIGGVEAKSLSSLNPAAAASLDGLIGAAIGPQIPGLSIPSIGVLFNLVHNSNEVNVLSSPNILTTDNEPAEISVGQNIPYQSTSISGLQNLAQQQQQQPGQTTAVPFIGIGAGYGQSIQRQDVALTLKLTPHVNESDSIRLEVDLEISDILTENFGGNGPSWSKRKVKTPIVVKDQQPVVIGGLMADKVSLEETKVPLLGDIPLLGYLFKYQVKKKIKTNLLVFLTPYIIKDQSDIERIFEQKVRERREFVEAYSAFEDRHITETIDYRRKRGLIAEIGRAVAAADEDDRLMEEAQKRRKRRGDEGPVEMPDYPTTPEGTSPPPEAPPQPLPPPQPPE